MKPHLLFVAEKWCDCNPNCGPTNNEHNLCGSFKSSLLGTHDVFYGDEYFLLHDLACDEALVNKCTDSPPDILVLSWFPRYPMYPKLETLNLIRSKLQIPMVAIWFDTVADCVMDWAESVVPFIDLNVVLDSTTAYLKRTNQPEKYLPMWTPQDPCLFSNPNLNRDIGISLVGSRSGRPDRLAGIRALQQNGINLYQKGGQREERVSVEEYALLYKRSQIALNFGTAQSQYKGRIFEATLCGAMLLESENPETAKWFEPMVDYVPFTGEADLVDKAKYYLEHEAERMSIAANGHQKAQEKYTGYTFWKTILCKINMMPKLPQLQFLGKREFEIF
ncbi:glycosyltransferase [Microcoleus sp. MON1_C1]|uniref:glycosyltransferase n=1 Tax=Microcoleus sp. MON1_C1 TaxID=2818827 RepID=UPI002FD1F8A9